jgi:hypothetical protein
MKCLLFALLLAVSPSVWSQKMKPQYALIPESLKREANAVVRFHETEIERISTGQLKQKVSFAVTILNSKGKNEASIVLSYDKFESVNFVEGRIYNSAGLLKETIKRKDFSDYSSFPDFVFFSDSRVLVYSPDVKEYPFTIEYEYQKSTNGFVHIDTWLPVTDYHVAIEKAELKYLTPSSIDFKHKADNFNFVFNESVNSKGLRQYVWGVENFLAVKKEPLSPRLDALVPKVLLAPVKFEYDGSVGDFTNWQTYGNWSYSLVKSRGALSSETVEKIKALTAGIESDREKVKAIYQFMQQKTRYVCISLGIGGFQPMLASDVDKYSYGDCKALSNYTRTLLSVVGIQSYYTEIGADERQIRYPDFASADQTNHVILTVPLKGDTIWLECTNPFNPFGYVGSANSNRKSLLVTPEGGKLIDMPYYTSEQNKQVTRMNVVVDQTGMIKGKLSVTAEGLRYEDQGFITVRSEKDQKEFLLKSLSLPNLTISSFAIKNEGEQAPVSTLLVDFAASDYATMAGERMFVPLNVVDKMSMNFNPKRERLNDIFIPYGITDEDGFEFAIPEGYRIEFLPAPVNLVTPYGTYQMKCEVKEDKVIYTRKLLLVEGLIEKAKYQDFAQTMEKINSFDNAKLILIKKAS